MANEVVTELTGKNTTLNPVLDAGERAVLRFGQSVTDNFSKIGVAVGAAFTVDKIAEWGMAAANVVKDFVTESVSAALEAEEAWAKWDATQRAAGDSIRITNEQLDTLASQLQSVTRFEDESVVAAASLLSVYENLNSEAFERTIKLGADMASLFGGDLESSVRQLGRALDNPIQGMRILRQAGVNLDEATKDSIKSLVEMGNIAGAQEIIFDKLEKKFIGVAEAMGETTQGRVDKLNNRFGELKETIGGLLIPAMGELLVALETFATGVETSMGDNTVAKIQKLTEESNKLKQVWFELGTMVPQIGNIGIMYGTSLARVAAANIPGPIGVGLGGALTLEGLRQQQAGNQSGLLVPGDSQEQIAARKAAKQQAENERLDANEAKEEEKLVAFKKRVAAIEADNWAIEYEKQWRKEQSDKERATEDWIIEYEKQWKKEQSDEEKSIDDWISNYERQWKQERSDKDKEAKDKERDRFEASFEDLTGLSKRITAAAQDTPEKKIEDAVKEADVNNVAKLDEVKKALEDNLEKQNAPPPVSDPLSSKV